MRVHLGELQCINFFTQSSPHSVVQGVWDVTPVVEKGCSSESRMSSWAARRLKVSWRPGQQWSPVVSSGQPEWWHLVFTAVTLSLYSRSPLISLKLREKRSSEKWSAKVWQVVSTSSCHIFTGGLWHYHTFTLSDYHTFILSQVVATLVTLSFLIRAVDVTTSPSNQARSSNVSLGKHQRRSSSGLVLVW